MLLKVTIAGVIFIVIWMVFFRVTKAVKGGGGHPGPARRTVKAQDLIKCPACGIYLPSDRPCDCRKRS